MKTFTLKRLLLAAGMLIVDATNAKAAEDSTFRKITNPELIYPGQKL